MKIKEKITRKLKRSWRSEEQLRAAFKANYFHFKQFLYANRKALEIMAEMEEALFGTQPFGMNAVRTWCTKVSTSVFQIIGSLNKLAPGKYEDLLERYSEIQKNVIPFIHPENPSKSGQLVCSLDEIDKHMADDVGAKMAYLGEIRKHIHVKVPNGFIVTARGYERFMEHNDLQTEINRRIQATPVVHLDQLFRLSSNIQMLISHTAKMPEDLKDAILRHYDMLTQQEGGDVEVAVRSSALGEDFHGTSFAGQYRSELNVRPENIIQAYKNVVASKYSLAAMTYRLNRGIRDEDAAICVGCMRMINAVSGGVVYSRNPANIRDNAIIISSVWGLPKSVVDGTSTSDIFVVSREDPLMIVRKEIGAKEEKTVPDCNEGLSRVVMSGEESRLLSLSDEQALEIARLAVHLETYAGVPQDIEWAIEKDGSIVLLQCRPLQQKDVSGIRDRAGLLDTEPETVILKGGITASPGVAVGPVFTVNNDVDALQFPDKAIIVAAQSLPRWAALLARAAAVVTEQGGIACHLATVAREFNVPALFGVKGAMEQLRNGQLVTVDADGQGVHRGHVHDLLKQAQKPKNLMEGSPVLEALEGAALCITPLTLLDPDSPAFTAKNCLTLHDITRFCHEKVLQEMFRFGKEHRLVERSGKKLICDLPMTYWAINLDDGFQEEVTGDSVHLDNVVSVPMLAFWDGLAAAPWKDPAPVRSRGLMSAFMEATMNPALEPTRGSHYATRNYCLISKNFCILQLRFNFHFCTVEAYVGETASDNYINFHFKGGAANLQRRMFRARLVAEMLGEYDFRTSFKEDAAFAQLKGHDQTFMKERLKVLGYIAMHTRQLDLAMVDAASIDRYRTKMLGDLKEILH